MRWIQPLPNAPAIRLVVSIRNMPVSDLTASAQDYLKVIWSATEWSGTPVTVGFAAIAVDKWQPRHSRAGKGVKDLEKLVG
jgi:DtxR family Mn-dependent transcriptional regulator